MSASEPPTLFRVLVVDDHPLVRDAICAAVDDEADLQVVGQAGTGRQAIDEALHCRPDVIVMDLLLPEMGGVDAIRAIKLAMPDVQVLALTSSADEAIFIAALEAGATGYLVKDTERADLLEAIRNVAHGNIFLSSRMATKLARRLRTGETSRLGLLSEREHEVLIQIGTGRTNREIAEVLRLTESTVRTHVQHILDKLGLANRNQAMVYALRTGITPSVDGDAGNL
jgi:two-component system, NarL family, response regulator LiaR